MKRPGIKSNHTSLSSANCFDQYLHSLPSCMFVAWYLIKNDKFSLWTADPFRLLSRVNDEIITNSECGNLEAELSKIIAVMSFASRGGGQPRNISGSRADIYYSVLKRMAKYLMKISHFNIRVIFRSNIQSSLQRSWSHSHAVYLAQKTRFKVTFSLCLINQAGARGIVVIKVLCYKPDGRGFENR